MLFQEAAVSSGVISLVTDFTLCNLEIVKRVDWSLSSGLYIPSSRSFEANAPMLGAVLLQKGLPRISLTWKSDALGFEPRLLYGVEVQLTLTLVLLISKLRPLFCIDGPDRPVDVNSKTGGQ